MPLDAQGREPGAPSSSGSGVARKIGPFPLWVWLVGVGGVGVWFWRRQQAAAAAAAAAGGPALGGTTVASSPAGVSGVIDPFTGEPISQIGQQGQTLDQWRAAAAAALIKAGVAPWLVEGALDAFLNQNPLTQQQADAINKAIGLVGVPPQSLPFLGTPSPPSTFPGPKPPIFPPHPQPINGTHRIVPLPPLPPGLHLSPGERIVQALHNPYGNGGWYISNLGGVFAVGGAPFFGSYLGLPPAGRRGHRTFTDLIPLANAAGVVTGYELVADTGQTYVFNADTAKQQRRAA